MKRFDSILLCVLILLLLQACVIPLPIVGGGIAGAGRDPDWIRNPAINLKEFNAGSVIPVWEEKQFEKIDGRRRDQYFLDFRDSYKLRQGIPSLVDDLRFAFTFVANERIVTIADDNRIVDWGVVPQAFDRDPQLAKFNVNHSSYYVMAINTRTSTGRVWLAIISAKGRIIYSASLKQGIRLIAQEPNGLVIRYATQTLRLQMDITPIGTR